MILALQAAPLLLLAGLLLSGRAGPVGAALTAMVGTSGSRAERSGVVTPRARCV